MLKIKIRYCGGCNPEIDRSETAAQLREALKDRAEWTYDPQAEADVTLHLSGCAHACLDEETTSSETGPVVSIQGLRVNRQSVNSEELIFKVAEKLKVFGEA
ncbi:MAG: hypothetical protein ACLFNW_12465 [Desulfobacterales bacterium]